jgi:hypothetical protein
MADRLCPVTAALGNDEVLDAVMTFLPDVSRVRAVSRAWYAAARRVQRARIAHACRFICNVALQFDPHVFTVAGGAALFVLLVCQLDLFVWWLPSDVDVFFARRHHELQQYVGGWRDLRVPTGLPPPTDDDTNGKYGPVSSLLGGLLPVHVMCNIRLVRYKRGIIPYMQFDLPTCRVALYVDPQTQTIHAVPGPRYSLFDVSVHTYVSEESTKRRIRKYQWRRALTEGL